MTETKEGIPFTKKLVGEHQAGPIWIPMHITAEYPILKNVILHGRTHGRDGCIVQILDRKLGPIDGVRYTRQMMMVGITKSFVKDVTQRVNILLELQGHPAESIEEGVLGEILSELFKKCESRYGNPITGSDYEVRVTFE